MCWHGTNNTLAFWSEHTIHSSIWITNEIKRYFEGRFTWDRDEDKSGRFRNRKMSVWEMSGQKLIWSHILSIFVTLRETLKENSSFLRYSIKWIVNECFRKRALLSPARLHFRGFERHDLPDLKATLGLAFQVYVFRDLAFILILSEQIPILPDHIGNWSDTLTKNVNKVIKE